MKRVRLPILLACCIFTLFASGQSRSGELITNGTFSDGLEGWKPIRHAEYKTYTELPAVQTVGGRPECRAAADHVASAHYLQIRQDIEVVEGKSYLLVIEARRRGGEGRMRVAVRDILPSNNRHLGLAEWMEVQNAWQRFEMRFTAKHFQSGSLPHIYVGWGEISGPAAVRQVSLTPIEGEFARPEVNVTPSTRVKPVSIPTLSDAFATNPGGAKATYTGGPIGLGGVLSSASKSGSKLVCGLEFGQIRILVDPQAIRPSQKKR